MRIAECRILPTGKMRNTGRKNSRGTTDSVKVKVRVRVKVGNPSASAFRILSVA